MNIKKSRDIENNKKIEKNIADFLTKKGIKVLEINKKENDEFDFLIENKKGEVSTIEMKKEDKYITKEKDTGNLFVEIECNEKPSGISTSKSDWYMFYLINIEEIWIIETPKLKHLMWIHNFKLSPYSGDFDNRTKGILIPRTIGQIKEQFTIINVK